MISARSKFKLIKRGFRKDLLLVPGWATDYRIFEGLDLDYNYILPIELNLFNFEEDLTAFLKEEAILKVSILGWSLGGFLAVEFASRNSERIEELILLSIRRRYNLKILQDIEFKLERNKNAYLYRFYQDCFSPADRQSLIWFKKHLLKNYLSDIKLESLISGIDYFSSVCLKPETLLTVEKIKIFHGGQDKIAPLKEAQIIKTYLPQAKLFVIPEAGHILFLREDFKGYFHE